MKALKPEMVEMPPQRVAVVTSKGDPNTTAQEALSALYGAVYTLKFDLKKQGKETFKVGTLRARWPQATTLPKEEWTAIWALPVPSDTQSLPQKSLDIEIKMDVWEYGTVAQVLHIGPYTEEAPTIEILRRFIAESGMEIAGLHEEEYLTTPKAKVQKTIIRYPVRPKAVESQE